MSRPLLTFTFATLLFLCSPLSAAAQQPALCDVQRECLCDTQYENCRTRLLNYIATETQGIDVAFWFMEDSRYVDYLIAAHQRNVPVRILVDQRANASKRLNEEMLTRLRNAGIPMRDKYTGGDILHFKMMLFHQQNIVQFSKANYTPFSFVPVQPNVNYFDEVIYYTDDNNITNSFRRRFDDLWINTSMYRNYANIDGPLVRTYATPQGEPLHTIHSSMNFPPLQNFATRAQGRYARETQRIDAMVYRVSDGRHTDSMIAAVGRGVEVRLISEPSEYRNESKLWNAKHIDRMHMAGVKIKMRKHEGLMHQASVVLHSLGEVIFGSSNWTTASAIYQDEHNYFYNPTLGKQWFFDYFAEQFERKWNDTVGFVNFQPLPPGVPVNALPLNGASGIGSSATLTWDGGPWAHLYDIYFGPNPNPPLVATNQELGSPEPGRSETFAVSGLLPGTTYYWRAVGKTWANMGRSGPTWSFTTAGTPPAGSGTVPFGTPAALPGIFQAENFDNHGSALAYVDATAGNKGGVYRQTNVDIEATLDAGGGYNIGWTRAGEWVKYTVDVTAAGTYAFQARVANVGLGGRFHVEVDGVDKTGAIAIPDTGGWQTWQTITKTGISLSAGQHVVRVVWAVNGTSGGAGNYNWFGFVQTTAGGSATTIAVPGVVQPMHFDVAALNVRYGDVSGGNSDGAYRTTGIGPSSDSAGAAFSVDRMQRRPGEWRTHPAYETRTRNYAANAASVLRRETVRFDS